MVRFIPKQFAENSNHSGVFGSFQEQGGNVGDGTLSSDPDTLQGGSAWPLGWSAATNSFLQIPRGEEIEGVERVFSAAIVQQFIDGITFWQPEMPVIQYQTIVQYQTGTDFPRLYINITGTSTETAPDTDTTNWFMFLNTEISYADTDASNFTAAGKSVLSGLGMPSNRTIDLTVGASGARYTAPGNGYFSAYNANGASGAVRFVNITKGLGINSPATAGLSDGVAFVPAETGDVIDMFYTGTFNTTGNGWFRFVYAEGESNV